MDSGFVHSFLDDAASAVPESSAIRDSTGVWNYSQLDRHSHDFARWLEKQGVRHGDRVLTQLPTTRELAAIFYGTSRRGAVFVPVNAAMKRYHLEAVLENSEPRLIIVADQLVDDMREITRVPVHGIAEVWNDLRTAPRQTTSADPTTPAIPATSTTPATATTPATRPAPGDVAVLVYTSGSTAAPKAVVCPHAQMVFATRAIAAEIEYRPDDVIFCRFPISWDYGLYKVLLACLGRSELVLADGESDLVLLRRIRETGATVVPIVPSLAAMITALAKRDTEPAPRVRMFTNTGAALSPATVGALRAAFPGAQVIRQFGQTECKRISVLPPEMEREKPDSVGRPLPGTRVLILDEDGVPVPTGQTGEIVVTGPHVMPGYWRAPELTRRTFRRDGEDGQPRLHTGDYGRLDDDGYLYYEGRRDDMFKRKGIRMSTIEIEAAATDIPGVRAAAVLPPADGRDLTLFAETELPPHTVLRELAKRLEAQKVPAVCRTVAEMPLTPHGKNAKQELALLVDGSAR
ncbi:amino acid adenylation domain-containing protein [Streptomyces sp. yr375]|uniref:AMP-binding protein n=1 Tax=Streptomyces sp. yr375 TaxID=1761906 RepID=UPI0008B6F9F3|nr:amino acid adenylation domain-containing protein [Streptomyces sp. yr375]